MARNLPENAIVPPPGRHATLSLSYRARASLPNTPLLTSYLLRLIHLKKSNLCVSADVTSTSELLSLAEEVGDSICILKTHADIIGDFSDRTVRGLKEVARRKKFLVFEDRKFGDIGNTVQKQYTGGPLSIAKWAEITNAHLFPGPAIIGALKTAASDAIAAYNSSVQTDITVGSPVEPPPEDSPSPEPGPHDELGVDNGVNGGRKQSVVSVTHTISTQTEPMSPQPMSSFDEETAELLGHTPFARGLLLLAEMSSEGNFLTGAYTEKCVELAREHKDFVMGFIAQRSLNSRPEDNFITMTPGVSLPPPGQEGAAKMAGDALGQQYKTPSQAVYEDGCDVIIVGRGIYAAQDWGAEAERYRVEGWKAYEQRISHAPS